MKKNVINKCFPFRKEGNSKQKIGNPKLEFLNSMKKKAGFTLIELMVSLSVLVVLLIIVYSVLLSAYRFYGHVSLDVDQENQANKILTGLKAEIQTATVDAEGNGIEIIDKNSNSTLISGGTKYYMVASDAGANTFYLVKDNGTVSVAFGSVPMENMAINFLRLDDQLIRVTISFAADASDSEYTSSIDIYSPNAAIDGVHSANALLMN